MMGIHPLSRHLLVLLLKEKITSNISNLIKIKFIYLHFPNPPIMFIPMPFINCVTNL